MSVKDSFALDACAVLAFLLFAPGYDIVRELCRRSERGEIALYMHNLNLLEVYYGVRRVSGEPVATVTLEKIRRLPIIFTPEIDGEMFIEAGRLKTNYKMSIADAVLLSAASVIEATVVTSDHHELDAVEKAESIRFLWIR